MSDSQRKKPPHSTVGEPNFLTRKRITVRLRASDLQLVALLQKEISVVAESEIFRMGLQALAQKFGVAA